MYFANAYMLACFNLVTRAFPALGTRLCLLNTPLMGTLTVSLFPLTIYYLKMNLRL